MQSEITNKDWLLISEEDNRQRACDVLVYTAGGRRGATLWEMKLEKRRKPMQVFNKLS